jgi:hypothetical protein
MKKLTIIYQNLVAVYNYLDTMTQTAYFKIIRDAESGKDSSIIKRYCEDEYDLISYSDALNLRFRFYYDLTYTYLKLYLEERHKTCVSGHKQLIERALEHKLITADESTQLAKITRYIKRIAKPDAHGNYEYTDDMCDFYCQIHAIISRLNPEKITTATQSAEFYVQAATRAESMSLRVQS